MRAFIFDKYGYYEEDEYGIQFDYKGWHFQLELTDKEESDVAALKEFLKQIPTYFPKCASDIIVSRDNKLVNQSNYGRVCLVGVKNNLMSLNDIKTFHTVFYNQVASTPFKISHLKKVWETKTDHIEEKILPRIKYNESTYNLLIENIAYASGLCENAIQYLSDIITLYGDDLKEITLTHKRLNSLDAYTFFNPFNMIVDCQSRDLSDLIKYDLCTIEEFERLLKTYNISPVSASLLLARLLYPTTLYDMLEEFHLVKHDITSQIVKYYNDRKKMMERIKKVHSILVNSYNIKPIEWLN